MAGLPEIGETYAHYRIDRLVGRGGMGAVYEATDIRLDRRVALKVVLPGLTEVDDFRMRFEREAATLARVRSRHIVQIYDYGEHDGSLFLITELLRDGDLQTWLTTHGRLEPRAALQLVRQVASALADAHAEGVVHRDVKPSNVLLWARPEGLVPYLCDFGIAVDGDAGLTRTGVLVGSPAYMAPERHLGEPATVAGDLYSLGCVLVACLTGTPPYAGTDYQLMNAHLHEPVPQLPGRSPLIDGVNRLLLRLLAKQPAERPASADELGAAIDRLVHPADPTGLGEAETEVRVVPPARAETTLLRHTPIPAPAEPDLRRGRVPVVLAAVGGVLVALVVALLAVLLTRDEPPPVSSASSGATAAQDAARTESPAQPASALPAGDGLVTIANPLDDEGFERSIAAFEAASGIQVDIEAAESDVADVRVFATPKDVREAESRLVPVSELVDVPAVAATLVPGLLDPVTAASGAVYAVPIRIGNKSLVYDAGLGLTDASSYQELVARSASAAGATAPWCEGWLADADTGWVGTDWLEQLVLEMHGPDVYDQWVAHQIPFDDPRIVDSLDVYGELVKDPGLVLGGPGTVLSTPYAEAMAPAFDTPPACRLMRQGAYALAWLPSTARGDGSVSVTGVPPYDGGYAGRVVVGGAYLVGVQRADQDVQELVGYLAGDRFGLEWAVHGAGEFISPHTTFDLDAYPDDLSRSIARATYAASVFRYDASDAMPAEVGRGTFWAGMVDWLNGASSADVLRAVEDSWPGAP